MTSHSKSPLGDYKAKRRFDATPEPAGEVKRQKNGAALRFVVQEHRASHLHYDFRLEAGGVLKSWAVPKGPTLRPRERRLAMQVEDHPLEYYDFEGIIPEGNYGAGEVIVWDAGKYTLLEGADPAKEIDRGKIKIALRGKKLHGAFTLVKMHGRGAADRGWLLLKSADADADPSWDAEEHAASVKSGRTLDDVANNPRAERWISNRAGKIPASPAPAKNASAKKASAKKAPPKKTPAKSAPAKGAVAVPKISSPSLCTLIKEPFDDESWLFEIKWDGVRALTTLDADGVVQMVSRNGLDQLKKYPELASLGEAFSGAPLIVDGEIVSLDKEGKSSFQRLQSPQNRGSAALAYVVFDLLFWKGRDLRQQPLETRKGLLERALEKGSTNVLYSKHVIGKGIDLFELARSKDLEGIIGKRRDAAYTEGRTRDWVKIKTSRRQECVIAGWTEPKGSRDGFGALLLGLYAAGELHYVGQVGTGFSRATLALIMKKLRTLEVTTCPFEAKPKGHTGTHWVKPALVAEIRFSEWTRDGMMRHPAFLGLRDDKAPSECIKEVAR